MKRIKNSILAILLLFGMMASSILPTFAQSDEWNDSIYHFNDTQDVISDDDFKAENALVTEAIETYQFDIATFIIDSAHYDEIGFYGYLDTIFKQNDMGYGVNQDGIVLGMDVEKESFLMVTFGRGQEIFIKPELDVLSKQIQMAYTRGGYLQAQQAYREGVISVLSSSYVDYEEDEYEYEDGFVMNEAHLYNKTYEKLPDWYVTDPSSFVDFHNDRNTARIIDNANLLNDEEKAELNTIIQEIYEKDHQDIVIYTDTNSYGIDNELYSQDFYVYNGYGYGDNYDGLILFVNMDPENREMVTSACGSSREIFTQSFLSILDNSLYDYFVDGEFGPGMVNWIHGVQNITHYGQPYVASWYKDYIDGTTPKNASEIKLVDDLNYFDESTYNKITDQINELKEKYGKEIVVYLTDTAYSLSDDYIEDNERVCLYADTFYQTQGYDKDGILLIICVDESSSNTIRVRTFGDVDMSDKVAKRLASLTLTNLGSGEYEKNINRYLNYLGKFLKSGRLPHTWPVRIFWFILCLIVGALMGSGNLSRAQAKMKTIKKATSAHHEMVPGSLKVHSSNNVFVNMTVNRVYSPQSKNSGSSGSSRSSGSTYSSNSRSSSGRSFSSSRKKF